jgi:aminopeptidase-like protein
VNKIPFGEPQLGKRNLYPSSDPKINPIEDFQAIKWLLNLADGESDLLDIADSSGIKISTLAEKARLLFKAGLIAELEN